MEPFILFLRLLLVISITTCYVIYYNSVCFPCVPT
jgi:hypothetical protein